MTQTQNEALTAPIPTTSAVAVSAAPDRPPGNAVATTTWLRLLVVPLAIAVVQAAWWSAALQRWPRQGALEALLVVPLLAGIVGWRRLHAVPRGPQIHDRQLDMILGFGLTALAVELLHLTDVHGMTSAFATGFLVVSAAAIMIVGWGTRAVWQLKGSLAVLLLAWPQPWWAAATAASPEAVRLATTFGIPTLAPLLSGLLLPVGLGLVFGLAVAGRALWRLRAAAHRPTPPGGGMVQASRRLTKAVPRARFATYAVAVLALGLFVLTVRTVPVSLFGVQL